MSTQKKFQLAAKAIAHQNKLLSDLEALGKSVARCEQTLLELKTELEAVHARHQDRKTTQDDIAFLTDLLKCANKKLGWEKQIASLKKRTPQVLEEMVQLLNDPENPPQAEQREAMLRTLQTVQAALERLEAVKVQ